MIHAWHLDKCSRGDIVESYGLRIILGKLMVKYQWKGFNQDLGEKSKYKDFEITWIADDVIYWPRIIRFTWEKEKGIKVESSIVDWIKTKAKRIKNFRKIRALEKEMKEANEAMHIICSDEMNGCPGDFWADHRIQMERLEKELWKLKN
jgi:hypothetical protein